MRFHGLHIVAIVLTVLLSAPQGRAAAPGPSQAPDTTLQPKTVPTITTAPVTYEGVQLADITTAPVTYEGVQVADITTAPVTYSGEKLGFKLSLIAKAAKIQPGTSASLTKPARRLPGVEAGLAITSPHSGQEVAGSVPLAVKITGWQGVPQVRLKWWWVPPAADGQWPSAPQGVMVVDAMNGKTELTIPRSAFPKSGRWRVEASVALSANQSVKADTTFILSGKTFQLGKAQAVQHKAKPMPLSAAKVKPAAGLSSKASLIPAGIPVILSPTENQHLASTGPLMIKARLTDAGADLVWEVAHQPFGSSRFAADRRQPTASPSTGASRTYSGRMVLEKPGHYRLRARVDAPGARWSQWRTIVVGTTPVAKPTVVKRTVKKTAGTPPASSAAASAAGGSQPSSSAGAGVRRPPAATPSASTPPAATGTGRVLTTPGRVLLKTE